MALTCLVCASCFSDLKPEVGKLKATSELGPVGDGMTGGNGAAGATNATGSDEPGNGGNGSGSNQTGNGDSAGDGGATTGSEDDGGPGPTADAGDDAGPGNPNGCAIKDSNPAKDVSFTGEIWPILSGCSCHNPNSVEQDGVLEVGLIIDSYTSLRKGGDNTRAKIIVAGDPCMSLLLHKLGEMPSFGVRMPRDGPYLSPEVRTLISDWIIEGARDN